MNCAISLFVFVAIVGAVFCNAPPGGPFDLEFEKWDTLTQRINGHLTKLKEEQGHDFKLIKIRTAQSAIVSGWKYMAKGEFEKSNGEKVVCDSSIWEQPWINFEQFKLICENNEYKVTIGQQGH